MQDSLPIYMAIVTVVAPVLFGFLVFKLFGIFVSRRELERELEAIKQARQDIHYRLDRLEGGIMDGRKRDGG